MSSVPLTLDDKLRYIHQRRAGQTFERIIGQRNAEVQEKVDVISRVMFQRKEEAIKILRQHIEEFDSTDIFESTLQQHKNLSLSSEKLKEEQKKLSELLASTRTNLLSKQKNKQNLIASVESLNAVLNTTTPALPFQEVAVECGKGFCKSITERKRRDQDPDSMNKTKKELHDLIHSLQKTLHSHKGIPTKPVPTFNEQKEGL